MDIEFRNEMKLGHRLATLLALPFFVFIALVFESFCDFFGSNAYDLVASILRGDMTRIVDFLGYLTLLVLSVGGTILVVLTGLYTALIKPNYTVTISPERQIVDVQYYLPWRKDQSRRYRFDEIEAVELHYCDEEDEIRLRLPDRRWALVLTYEVTHWGAQAKMKRLKEMGLPTK